MKTDDTKAHNFEGMPKENPFRVPEGYFDRFPDNLAERIQEEKKVKQFPFSLRSAIAFAAAVLLLIAGVLSFRSLSHSDETLTKEEISMYVAQDEIIEDLEIDEIIEQGNIEISCDTISIYSTELEKSEIQRYLIEEGIEESDIINEL